MFNYISIIDKTNYRIKRNIYTLRFNFKRRLIYLAFGTIAFLLAYYCGARVDINKDEAKDVKGEFIKKIDGIDQNGIFINNLMIALGMFIPIVGIGLGIFSGFSTGLVFNALAETSPYLQNVSPLAILLTPYGIMEVFAYGLAISRSGMLVYHLVRKKPWREYGIPTIIEIGIIVMVLIAAAVIEWQIIMQFGGPDITMPKI
jgi:uncharacterized membrane protein SpoIIM required for sporulation